MPATVHPDDLLYTQLQMLFPTAQIGVGGVVYHAAPGQDPIAPYVTYQRVSSEWDRDLAGNPMRQVVNYNVQVASKFFNQIEIDFSTLDNWSATDADSRLWYFDLTDQVISDDPPDQQTITFSFVAAASF